MQKSSAAEKVGVFAIRDGKLQVVEYSEMSESDASAKDDKGSILYPWGNICMHYFTVAFLERAKQWLAETGKYHVAHKKIPSVNGPVEVLWSRHHLSILANLQQLCTYKATVNFIF